MKSSSFDKKSTRSLSTITAFATALAAGAAMLLSSSAFAIVSGAVWTTDVGGTVDRNLYNTKCEAFLSGGPRGNQNTSLIDGTYYFQVTNPSGSVVLSTADASARAVSVLNGLVVGPVPLCEYNDSENGEYKAWLVRSGTDDCQVSFDGTSLIVLNKQGHPAIDSCSKTDNFRIDAGACIGDQCPCVGDQCPCVGDQCPCGDEPGQQKCPVTPRDPVVTVTKTAFGVYDLRWPWSITKSGCLVVGTTTSDPCQTKLKQIGGNATFSYTVTVTPGSAQRKNNEVTGTIEITALDGNDTAGTPIPASGITVTDQLAYGLSLVNDDAATCVLDDPVPTSFTGVQQFGYHCTYNPDSPADLVGETNLVAVTSANAAYADFLASFLFGKAGDLDDCVAVTDQWNGGGDASLGSTVCLNSATKFFTYTHTVPVPANGCTDYPNLAKFTSVGENVDNPNNPQNGSAGQAVTVCGPVKSGGLTIGYWQNKNGQGIITGGAATAGVCNSGSWLRQYAPFQDLSATATCTQVGTYVTGVIKAANASGSSMNAMLKAQMLATALDVYFSNAALGGNKIAAPSPIGAMAVDLTKICKMIDGTGGIATCSGTYQNVSSAFGGATSLTVSQILAYAAGQSNGGGSSWYGNVKATQELAKNTFDAINNQVVFAP